MKKADRMTGGLKGAFPTVATAVLGVAAFVFFAFVYPGHIAYQEQYQMFLYTSAYTSEVLWAPGGVADYAARFLIQFFIFPPVGAAITALLLVALQRLCMSCLPSRSAAACMLSFLPAAAAWCFLCDENAMYPAVVSLILSLGACRLTIAVKGHAARAAVSTVLTPLMYLAAGPLAVLYAAVMIVRLLASDSPKGVKWGAAALITVLAVLCPVAAHAVFPYPLHQLLRGVHYMRFPLMFALWAWISAALALGAVVVSPLLSRANGIIPLSLATALVVAFTGLSVYDGCDMAKEESIVYDRLAYRQKWHDIIAKAERKAPRTPMAVRSLNLALAMTSQLGDRMFEFYQNGLEGLFPAEVLDFTTPLPAAEVYYHMGVPAMSHYLYYDAQQGVPDGQKSARCTMRLAETDIILGNLASAHKYLSALDKTLFYSDKADSLILMLGDSDALMSHPEYGQLRVKANSDDTFNRPTDKYAELALLTASNPDNALMREYMLAAALLANDPVTFGRFFDPNRYPVLPEAYQEFLAMRWVESHDSWDGFPFAISPRTKARMEQFVRDYSRRMPTTYMQETYGDTYWNYIIE